MKTRKRRASTYLTGLLVVTLGPWSAPAFAAEETVPAAGTVNVGSGAPRPTAPSAASALPSVPIYNAADAGYTAGDPEWIEWAKQFAGGFDDRTKVKPLPPKRDLAHDPASARAGTPTSDDPPDNIPVGSCGWWWVLGWDPSSVVNPDDDLNVEYGLGATCVFPDVGWPAWESRAQASLRTVNGTALDTAPVGRGAWDCPGCDGLSSDVTPVNWPTSIYLSGWSQIALYPGCDPSGCGDPADWWFWGPVPEGCTGTGTPLLECEFRTEVRHIGETVCGDDWSSWGDWHSATATTSCVSGSTTVQGKVALRYGQSGRCAYVYAWFADGSSEWAGTCDPDASASFDWTRRGQVVQLTAWAQENPAPRTG